ncbi:hypothetical protein HYFRA_00006445, partial [Hymenoscyphus fraxineus]
VDMEKLRKIKTSLKNDRNLKRSGNAIKRGWKKLPSATETYMREKVPVVGWLPNYDLKWIASDAIAGSAMGMMLIPQAITYATLAGIPIQNGIQSTWIPSLIYCIMGTSKDLSTGPTSLTGILTNFVIMDYRADKRRIPPTFLGAGVAIAVGLMSLFLGLLNMGWILDFASLPILVGFMLTASLIAVQGQLAPLLGVIGVGNDFLSQPKEILQHIDTAEPATIAMGISTIIILAILQTVDQKLGKKNFIIHLVASSRYLFVLTIMTIISYLINRNRDRPLWAIAGQQGNGFQTSGGPSFGISLLVLRQAMPVFLATIVQHLALAKSFSRRHGYDVNPSQELTYLGVSNIASGLLGGMPVSAEISRTAVNEASDVKSPLSGIFTTIVVLLGLQVAKDAVFYIPSATIAGMIIVAAGGTMPDFKIVISHWKGSFIDFLSCQIVVQGAFLASLDTGVLAGAFFMVGYTMLRSLFERADPVTSAELDVKFGVSETKRGVVVQDGVKILQMRDDVYYINAKRIMKSVFMRAGEDYKRITNMYPEARLWCEPRWGMDDRASLTRSQSNLRVLILDFTRVGFVDLTTLTYLEELKAAVRTYANEGNEVELRFVGLSAPVKLRFDRVGWKLVDGAAPAGGDGQDGDRYFENMRAAVETPIIGRNHTYSELNFEFGDIRKDAVGVSERYVGF